MPSRGRGRVVSTRADPLPAVDRIAAGLDALPSPNFRTAPGRMSAPVKTLTSAGGGDGSEPRLLGAFGCVAGSGSRRGEPRPQACLARRRSARPSPSPSSARIGVAPAEQIRVTATAVRVNDPGRGTRPDPRRGAAARPSSTRARSGGGYQRERVPRSPQRQRHLPETTNYPHREPPTRNVATRESPQDGSETAVQRQIPSAGVRPDTCFSSRTGDTEKIMTLASVSGATQTAAATSSTAGKSSKLRSTRTRS